MGRSSAEVSGMILLWILESILLWRILGWILGRIFCGRPFVEDSEMNSGVHSGEDIL